LRKAGRQPPAETNCDALKRTEAAVVVWRASHPAEGTPVATYLHSRGLTIPVPPSVRFQAGLRYPSGGVWPAMVALATLGVDGKPIGIHRTFLKREGNGKAPVEPAKIMLGQCRGGAVRLGQPESVLMVGEGIETCLAAMQATGQAAWAALSTSGLRGLDLPPELRDVIASPMATTPEKPRRTIAPGAGSGRAGASASPVHRRAWTSTICFCFALLASGRPRDEHLERCRH
jgi:putative DNA primase/helicase